MNENDIRTALRSEFGKAVENMDAEELATAVAAISRFGRNGNSSARSLAVSLADLMRSKNSKYLYNQYKDKSPEYINLKTIGLCTAYRYYYEISRRTATMTQGGKTLIFRSGSGKVTRSGKEENLIYMAVLEGDLYVSEDDAAVLLGCHSEYIPNSGYAICLTESMESKAEEVLNTIMDQ